MVENKVYVILSTTVENTLAKIHTFIKILSKLSIEELCFSKDHL